MSSSYIHTNHGKGFARLVLKLLAVLYFLGVAAIVAYLWLFTQDRYISTASFKISKQDTSSGDAGLAQIVLPGLADSGAMDSQVVIGYIDSVELLLALESEFDLINHFSSPTNDFVFRLNPDAPLEERVKYYRNRITSHFLKDTGLTMLNVDTFDPMLSKRIAQTVLDKAEAFVNRINQSIADQQFKFIRNELEGASARVNTLTDQLLELQNRSGFISPDEAISTTITAVRELQMERLRLNAELASLTRDSPNSPTIEPLRSRLRSLNELIDVESSKLSGPEMDRLNKVLVEFKELQHQLDFAVKLRSGTELSMEQNRVEAIARSRFFSVIQPPFLPEEPALPRRPYATMSILVIAMLVFLIFRALTHSMFERA
jgi:capsular polysaccharide transport system permease protein